MKKGIRRCIQCRLVKDREQMHRLNRETTGVDAFPVGRSMYVCQQTHCLQAALKNRRLYKHLPGLSAAEWEQICQKRLHLTLSQDQNIANS